jgi:uncharacterized protein YndB with AHSA1/START domain
MGETPNNINERSCDMDTRPVVVERTYDAPVSKVWKAITDRGEMKKWYFDLSDFKPQVGFQFEFLGGPAPDKQYLHKCEITEVIPEKRLTHSWRYEGHPGNSLLMYELTKQGNKTLLKLTHRGIETFPRDNPDFARGNFEEGWNQIIHTSLKNYLEPGKRPTTHQKTRPQTRRQRETQMH